MGCLKLTYHEKPTNTRGYTSRYLIVSKEPQGFFSFNRKKIDVCVYRYGFNGMEKDDEVYSTQGSNYTSFHRSYDARLGRWWSLDPEMKQFPDKSPFVGFSNNPMIYVDPVGDADFYFNGKWIGTDGRKDNVLVKITDNKVRKQILKNTKTGLDYTSFGKLKNNMKIDGGYAVHRDVLTQSLGLLDWSLKEENSLREGAISMSKSDEGDYVVVDFKKGTKSANGLHAASVKGLGVGVSEENISIHSHPTGLDKNGDFVDADKASSSADETPKESGGDIENMFPIYNQNIIVGKNGGRFGGVSEETDLTTGRTKVKDNRHSYINFFDQGKIAHHTSIEKTEADNMMKTDKGKNYKKYEKKRK